MGDALFVLKCFVVTFALVVLMQIRIGGRTIENRAVSWIHNSSAVDNVRMAAEGAVKVTNEGWDSFSEFTHKHIGTLFSDNGLTNNASLDPVPGRIERASQSSTSRTSAKERRHARSSGRADSGPTGPEID